MKTRIAGLLFVTFGFALAVPVARGAEARKPNVLVIVADDLGYGELSCQGNPQIPTPNIDSIARNGIRFTSGYVSGPYCSPTRAGLLTGRYQQRFGHEFNPGPAGTEAKNFGLPLKETTLAERLKSAGYATGMFGKWHLGYRPELQPTQRGFDEYFGFLGGAHSYLDAQADAANPILRGTTPLTSTDYTTDAFGREAIAFIEKHRQDPWFVYLPFNAVHAPLQASDKYRERFKSIEDDKRRTFAAMLSALDDNVGLVLSRIRSLDLEKDTLIIFISDNGGPTRNTTSGNAPLNGFKAQVWEGGIRVPFLVQWKGRIPAGKVFDRPVIQLDIHPTVLAAVGLSVPKDAKLDGVNLLPHLTGDTASPPHDSLFWRFGEQRAVRKGDWKLTDLGQGPKLFNLAGDIGEKNDLAAQHPAKLAELEAAYVAWNASNIEAQWKPAPPRRPAAAPLGAAQPRKPNVLFIAVDDLNHWVGYLGRNPQTITPNIDKLAARGVRFTHNYCAAPVCNPSRAALMSGLRPATSGVYENDDDWRRVIPEELPLTTTFRKAGYSVRGAGKIYHGSFPRRSEWDDYLSSEGTDPKPTGDTGVGGIKFAALDCRDEDLREWNIVQYGIDQLAKAHDRPFFLAIGLHKPHMPWNVPRKYYDLHPLESIELPPHRDDDLRDLPPAAVKMARPDGDHRAILESGRWKEAVQAYLAAISYCDAMIGRLIDALERSPDRDNTIVVFWGDHGWHLGEKQHWRKFALWEEATRAPLIWIAPGLTKAGAVCNRTVDFMSIYPTLTDLCGISTPNHVEGRSIRKLIADPDASWNAHALTTYRFRNHAVRNAGWRYIRYANGDEELYDEQADPYEWTNLAQDPRYTAKKAELAKLLPTRDHADITEPAEGTKAE